VVNLRRLPVFALFVVAACSTNTRPLSLNDEVRNAYLNELKILAVDDHFAVARSRTDVLEFERNRTGSRIVRLRLPIAADWVEGSTHGFSAFVDETRLRRSYSSYLKLTQGETVLESPVSSESPLASKIPRRANLAISRDGQLIGIDAYEVHCLGSDGRYAFCVVTGINAGHPIDGCFNTVGFPRLVVFRADNGRDWKVYDEGVIPSKGFQAED
jgi:hypothetical protein